MMTLEDPFPSNVTLVVLRAAGRIDEVGLQDIETQVVSGGELRPCETISALRELADALERDYGTCAHE